MRNKWRNFIGILLSLILCFGITGCDEIDSLLFHTTESQFETESTISISDIPEYNGTPYVVINDN